MIVLEALVATMVKIVSPFALFAYAVTVSQGHLWLIVLPLPGLVVLAYLGIQVAHEGKGHVEGHH